MILPAILIVGPSGSGKSSSLRNLPKDKTVILNIERKMLPFKEAVKFNNINIADVPGSPAIFEYDKNLDKAVKDDNVRYIVHESFTRYSDELLKRSKLINKGFEIYNYYADNMIKLIDKISSIENKWNIIIALEELVDFMQPNGTKTMSRRVAVNGQKLEGKIESYFTLVLFTEKKVSTTGQITYHFITNGDNTLSAKSPFGMFEQPLIDNDIFYVIDKASKHWGLNT